MCEGVCVSEDEGVGEGEGDSAGEGLDVVDG